MVTFFGGGGGISKHFQLLLQTRQNAYDLENLSQVISTNTTILYLQESFQIHRTAPGFNLLFPLIIDLHKQLNPWYVLVA